jgi:hypothetical protein
MSARRRHRRVFGLGLKEGTRIPLAGCALLLLATSLQVDARQLGEAEANEVRHVDEHGTVYFDLPPASKTPAPVSAPGTGDAVYYIQTESGLVECTSDFIRPGACRPATITEATMRSPFLGKSFFGAHWIVKRGGHWLDCHGPRKGDVCGPFRDFPFPRQ